MQFWRDFREFIYFNYKATKIASLIHSLPSMPILENHINLIFPLPKSNLWWTSTGIKLMLSSLDTYQVLLLIYVSAFGWKITYNQQSYRTWLFPGFGRDESNSRELRYIGKINSHPRWFYNWTAIKYPYLHSGYSTKIRNCSENKSKYISQGIMHHIIVFSTRLN